MQARCPRCKQEVGLTTRTTSINGYGFKVITVIRQHYKPDPWWRRPFRVVGWQTSPLICEGSGQPSWPELGIRL